ncbi:Ion channel protein, partial [Streptomyces sp. AC563]|nr:Ion channel protein [Streptomyces buecherae]
MKLPSQDTAARNQEPVSHHVQLPRFPAGPLRQVGRRLLIALFVMVTTVLLVYLDREGYHDNADGAVDFLD